MNENHLTPASPTSATCLVFDSGQLSYHPIRAVLVSILHSFGVVESPRSSHVIVTITGIFFSRCAVDVEILSLMQNSTRMHPSVRNRTEFGC